MNEPTKAKTRTKNSTSGKSGKVSPKTPNATKKIAPKSERIKHPKVSPKDKPTTQSPTNKSPTSRKSGTSAKKNPVTRATKAPAPKAKETVKPTKPTAKTAPKDAGNKAPAAKAPTKASAVKSPAVKSPAVKLTTGKVRTSKAVIGKAATSKVPAAKVPAAKVPAAKVPAAKVPFASYKGARPYIFVSYSHKDMTEVFGIIKRLSESRYRLWYDEGIEPGFEWPEVVGKALTRCSQLIVFMSRSAAISRNVRNEINLAFSEGKGILVVYLEKTKLTEGMKLQIGTVQFLNKYEMNAKEFVEKLKSVLSNDLHN